MIEFFMEEIKKEQQRGDKYFEKALILSGITGKLECVAHNKDSFHSKDVQSFAAELLDEIKIKLEALK